MDKMKVISAFKEAMSAKVRDLASSLEDTKKRAQGAPGSNTTHSDTSKFQLGNLALSIDLQVQKAKEVLSAISGTPVHYDQAARVGSLIELFDKKIGQTNLYFMVVKGGGETVIVDGITITTIAVAAPLGRACVGKRKQDEISCNGRAYFIQNID
ncbi:MAG: hypothetical protein WAP55_03595 [Minisyncoccia bacterium]